VSTTHVSVALRRQVRERAGERCEFNPQAAASNRAPPPSVPLRDCSISTTQAASESENCSWPSDRSESQISKVGDTGALPDDRRQSPGEKYFYVRCFGVNLLATAGRHRPRAPQLLVASPWVARRSCRRIRWTPSIYVTANAGGSRSAKRRLLSNNQDQSSAGFGAFATAVEASLKDTECHSLFLGVTAESNAVGRMEHNSPIGDPATRRGATRCRWVAVCSTCPTIRFRSCGRFALP